MMSILEQLIDQVIENKYHIEGLLGKGGMGAVFHATHVGTKRRMAVKVIAPQYMADEEFVERFKREAEAAGRINHPNVVNVTDFGFSVLNGERIAYLVMEYLQGRTLGQFLAQKKMVRLEIVLDILDQICQALAEAHKQGIIHRDLKPDNIWLEEHGRGGYHVKVLDFGLAKLRDYACATPQLEGATVDADAIDTPIVKSEAPTMVAAERPSFQSQITVKAERPMRSGSGGARTGEEWSTQVGTVLGTPQYMSPEQCLGGDLDARSDIYSIGVIAYQMLSGDLPFNGTMKELITKHTTEAPPPLSANRYRINRCLRALIMKTLSKDRQERPASAQALAAALKATAQGTGTLMRRSLMTAGEHYPILVRILGLALLPIFLICLFRIANVYLIKSGVVSQELGKLMYGLVYLTQNVLSSLILPLAMGVLTYTISHLLRFPMESVNILSSYSGFKSKLLPYVTSTLIFLSIVSLGGGVFFLIVIGGVLIYYLWRETPLDQLFALMINNFGSPTSETFLALGIISIILIVALMQRFCLYIPVVMMEGKGGFEALKRSRELVSTNNGAALMLSLICTVVGNAVYSIVLIITLKITQESLSDFVVYSTGLSEAISIIIFLLILPFVHTGMVLFYLNARQASGETLDDILSLEPVKQLN